MRTPEITLLPVEIEGFRVTCLSDVWHLMVELNETAIDYIQENPECEQVFPVYRVDGE